MFVLLLQQLLVARVTLEGVAEVEGVAGFKHLTGSMIRVLLLVQTAWLHLAIFHHLVGSHQQCHQGLS